FIQQAMKVTNEQMQPEKIASILKQFEEENMKMDMKDEMSEYSLSILKPVFVQCEFNQFLPNLVEESLNGILDNSDDEAEQDQVVNQILDEIGIEVNQKVRLTR